MSIVIDTSAVIAVVGNEPHRARLLELTQDEEIVAPPTLPWEIANALSAAFKRRKATLQNGVAALALFEKMPVWLVGSGSGNGRFTSRLIERIRL